jgi:hypothetical protein
MNNSSIPNDIHDNQLIKNQQVTLLELLDRLIDKGVVVKGEIMLSVADIDLIYLNLGLLLSSVKTVEQALDRDTQAATVSHSHQRSSSEAFLQQLQQEEKPEATTASTGTRKQQHDIIHGTTWRKTASPVSTMREQSNHSRKAKNRANIDKKNVEKGLLKLVLTLVDLVRRLMEQQAIRRIEYGQLNREEIEAIGNAFYLLNEKMNELKENFGLTDEDLNLDLGPLGELL